MLPKEYMIQCIDPRDDARRMFIQHMNGKYKWLNWIGTMVWKYYWLVGRSKVCVDRYVYPNIEVLTIEERFIKNSFTSISPKLKFLQNILYLK